MKVIIENYFRVSHFHDSIYDYGLPVRQSQYVLHLRVLNPYIDNLINFFFFLVGVNNIVFFFEYKWEAV